MIERAQVRMTAAEFLQMPETNQLTELLDGEPIVSPSPLPRHQIVSGEFYSLVKTLIPNGRVFFAPMDVYLDDYNVVQPDIFWAAEGGRCRVTELRVEGPPDLVIEVFSSATSRRDKKEKFRLYERHGVREYWMADPLAQYVEVYRLVEGHYQQQGVYGPDESFESAVLGDKPVPLQTLFTT